MRPDRADVFRPIPSGSNLLKLYIAGIFAAHFHHGGSGYQKTPPNAKLLRDSVKYNLESYHYIKKGNYVRNIKADGARIFLDSGAFSSFSLGVDVNINDYADFIKENKDFIDMASVLDAIGDPVGTFHNQNTLEKLGVEVLPCFHYGEPWDLCEYYLNNYEYITIGGMVPIPNQKLEGWLDELWDKVLTDNDGYSRRKVHGFGLTARNLMEKYPWFSCDSSSWIQAASNGSIVLPEYDRAISVSARSPSRKNFGQHFNTMPKIAQDNVVALLEYYGLSLPEVQDTHMPRWALNAFTYDRLGDMLGDDHWRKPFSAAQGVLF
jgi:hypothetical protein